MVALALLVVFPALRLYAGENAEFPAESIWVLDGGSFMFRGIVMDTELRGTCVLEGSLSFDGASRDAALRARANLQRRLRDRGLMIEILERLEDGRWLCRVRPSGEPHALITP